MSQIPTVSNPANTHAFYRLGPEQVLQAVESLGFSCSGRQLALNSYENRVYQIGLEADEPTIVAKFYRPNRWSDAAIREEHDFTLDLSALDIPAVPPLLIEGQTLHHFQSYRFALYPFMPGRAPDLENAGQIEQLGRYFGRLHAAGRSRTFTERDRLDVQSFGDDAYEYLLEQRLLPTELEDNYARIGEDLLNAIEDIFAAIDANYIRLQGDAHPGNILWQGGAQGAAGSPCILDFDDARMGPAVQDLWMFISGNRNQMQATLATLLDGYTAFSDFNAAELRLIEPLRSLRIMHHAAWLAKRRTDPVFRDAFPWFNTQRYWEEHLL
ncbi:MAG: serine/threonine protein kinase [Mariprofundaceae bacterium]